MTVTIIITSVATITTVLAFLKQGVRATMLHVASLIAWIISGYALYNLPYSTQNTYIPTALFMFATVMVLINLAASIMAIIAYYRTRPRKHPTYEEEQAAIKEEIRRRVGGF